MQRLSRSRHRTTGPGARRRRPSRRDRLGSRHPDLDRLRSPPARPARPLRGQGPEHLRGRDRHHRRPRSPDRSARPHRPGDDRMDGRLQAPRAGRRRSHRRPGALRLPHQGRRQGDQVGDRSDARSALLLQPPPGRAARPEDRQDRPPGADQLRHQLADPGRAAAPPEQRPRPDRQPAAGGRGPPRRPAGDRRRSRLRTLLEPLLAGARRARRRRPRPAR